ncbi:cell envelope integrity protein TolA [Telluria mixta]|uniref:Cell envelope integrity protein TolA n=1 Tax=Telluria mixta TaxID=34071 RepID=A0ABT2C8E3_9BURK|nr:cell envelope integrity protein TolA [Telluria mixta]MCS0633061.1 cell envelope integrity protein TolA [Telluria mixta]WEM96123.1 cell envelope integrity protein TolA [Telluria mixta]
MSATKQTNIGNSNGAPYHVPPEPNRWPAIGLAVGVHAMLLAFLWIGVSWQNNAPVAVEAEIWDVTTQTAAPPPAPAPEPEPEPETPPPQPAPKAVEPPPPVVEKPQPKAPDIALEREKKRKEELKRKQIEEERERELAEQKRAEEKKAKALAEKKERELEEKKAKADAEKKEAEKKKKEDAEKKKKEEADKKKKAAEEQKKLDAARAEEMRRITGAAGNPTSTGTAEKSTAPRIDKGYTAAITAKVKGNTSYAGSLDEPGNPTATFRVEQLPTGEIISVKKIKSSGVPSFDDAVEKGITKSSPLPKKKDGTVERSLVIEFHMKDLQ